MPSIAGSIPQQMQGLSGVPSVSSFPNIENQFIIDPLSMDEDTKSDRFEGSNGPLNILVSNVKMRDKADGVRTKIE